MKATLRIILLATLLMGATQTPPPTPTPPKPPAPPAAPATQAAPVPPSAPAHGAGQMTTYFIAFLKKGPAWTASQSPELKSLQEAHLANIRRQSGH